MKIINEIKIRKTLAKERNKLSFTKITRIMKV